ncbi:metal-sensing transcriptional repressor [Kocuria indica]|uniref:Metal-sensing transcriptional repressor n=1 Tax=Kocuria marina subsp. indica TaxID=1049583 RepID=A0A6N9R0L9_9MICC|nr:MULTISPECIES: metal-sensitive transcriptional regulator [Kocuria]MCT1616993.1 metal-sensitive transcriptional regulator [Kocuria marina]NDO78100.1 metal-sensing transcriptional repressor [Kocuria indica]
MSSPETPTRGYTQDKAAYARRLKRIEGQVRGVQRMIDEDTYCIDVLTQISAIQSALKSVSLGLMEEHLGHCVRHAVEAAHDSGDTSDMDAKLAEANAAIARLVKS